MAVLTREDVYNKMVNEKKPVCPHCGQEMVIWECPPMTFSDGLGWGTPYLYVCFYDDCPLYLEGWKNIMDNYANVASYRCICDPTSRKMDCMPVFSRDGGKGYIIDEEVRAREEARKAAEKKGLEELQACYEAADTSTILKTLLDKHILPAIRAKAAEMIGEIGGLDVIEPIRNHVFENEVLNTNVEVSIQLIHKRHYTKECPFCAEIIKARAVVCKHCGKDLPEDK
ncbi:MAG: zinc ribbon domain-containing protein [Deltaproteobacteria bacterium]|nr:zinc ribbon domain-containing protein [Deltaproteobacteria bacterium]MBW2021031.1 zinc ribbon domain-containing protein [Deltaproteobacteria bacterium]MBW2075697.1 zinc ribbon domain-containing protein [Deltaproteobacteria bacterium]RLB81772.1 MAG: zinc ribbon domain-containing protein [Deltaproteobacteria bacterium]